MAGKSFAKYRDRFCERRVSCHLAGRRERVGYTHRKNTTLKMFELEVTNHHIHPSVWDQISFKRLKPEGKKASLLINKKTPKKEK